MPLMATTASALLLLAGSSRQADQPVSQEYTNAVRRYAAGETDAALAILRAWPERRVREEVRALVAGATRCDECDAAAARPDLPLPAVLMLHTDCALAVSDEPGSSGVCEETALALGNLLARSLSQRDFARRWFAMRARTAREAYRWDQALVWAERGVRLFPESAALHLLRGQIEELLGTEAAATAAAANAFDHASSASSLDPGAREHLEKARLALRSAIAADGRLAEPRLREARVSFWLGDGETARARLEELLALPIDERTQSLAQLFLGAVQEAAGRLDAAIQSYQAAALFPDCRAARLALSHARWARGDEAGAGRELDATLRAAPGSERPDLYGLYLAPPPGAAARELATLRHEASE